MMTPELFRDDDGQPTYIQGYGAVFDVLRSDNHSELVRPWAFDHIVKDPPRALNCQFHHGGLHFIAGSVVLDTLQIWADDYGLAFSAGPFNACGRNRSLLRLISCGDVRGASWSGRYNFVAGERVKVIRRFNSLDHIAPVADPAYEDTAVWLSSEHPDDLPPRLKMLSEFWAANRPRFDTGRALRKMARAVSRLPRRAVPSRAATSRSQARPFARRRAPVLAPLAVHEIYPPFGGFSSIEIAKLAFQERKAWRMLQSGDLVISRTNARRAI